jgi:type II protein arginine methyltransferase
MTTLPLDDFLKRGAESPMALAQLAGVFHNMGNKTRARELAMQATAAAPDDPEIRSLVAIVLSNTVPRWHFEIVRDQARNAA